MLELKEVIKSYSEGKFKLDVPAFTLPEGYICGLVGRNGSGKTTFLNLFLGLLRQNEGEVLVDGMKYPQQEKEIHDLMGFVLVDELLRKDLTLKDNGLIYGRFYSRFQLKQYIDLLQKFQLDEKTRFGKLSKGQKLKAQFAFALACNPKYLFLDEPTANFDPEFRSVFLEEITQFVANGDKSVILATHLTDDLDRIADYLIDLDEGKVVFNGEMEAFREEYRIVSGEKYKINLLKKENVICVEDHQFTTKALVKNSRLDDYSSLTVAVPSGEEFMYFYARR